MEVNQLQAMSHPLAVEQLTGLEQLSRGKTELSILPPAGGPLARSLGGEANPDTDPRLGSQFLGDGEDLA